jgi:hypothetical protein
MSDNTMNFSVPIYTSVFPTRSTTHGYVIYSSSATSPLSTLVDKNKKTYWLSDTNTFNNNGDYIGTSSFNGIQGEFIGMDCDFLSVIDSITFTHMSLVARDVDLGSIRLLASIDKETWDELSINKVDTNMVRFINPLSKMYKNYVIIIPKSSVSDDSSTQICINELKIFLRVYKDTYHTYFNSVKLFSDIIN